MHIYIHIPFCESKCPYCAFASFADKSAKTKAYFGALADDLSHQLSAYLSTHQDDSEILSVYFGGGTPSVVDAGYYERIFEILAPYMSASVECTAEANPSSLNTNWLKTMKSFGINRLSIGVQSFDDEKLRFLGRIHSSKQALAKIDLAKSHLDDVSIDIIYGTKYDTKKFLQTELDRIPMHISHLSAYTLMLEKGTLFDGKVSFQNKSIKNIEFFIKSLENLGFKQYEISSFARTKPSYHNKAYWQGANYLGIGFGAVGFVDDYRTSTGDDLDAYIAAPTARNIEHLKPDDLAFERLFLGLRSDVGVELSAISGRALDMLDSLKRAGKVHIKDGKIFNNDYLLADEIAVVLANF